MNTIYIVIAFLAGCGLPLQAAANARLGKAVASPFAAATLQLFVATVLLFIAVAAGGALPALGRLGQAHWWQLLGGLASAMFVVAGIVFIPRIGAVTTIGLFIAGQAFTSLLLDGAGLLGVVQRAPGPFTWLGAACVAAGILLIVRGQRPAAGAPPRRIKPAWVAAAALCGGVLPVQGALNAAVARTVGAPLVVSLASFAVATAGMAIVLALVLALNRNERPTLGGLCAVPWWAWLGGPVGVCYVTTVFLALPVIGAAATVGFTIAGQQVVAILTDRFGLFGLPKSAVSGVRLAGALVLLAGVVSIKLP
ncbi:EamA-like transporter family protein [Massilia sp. NEAU-DD11]|uniref:EamA-like transporter family protein n=1 Tax=Massilia cellulosiltytica TaxID=2683234 RepID=A0A7X3G394_9BURK|nr:DMT family transporter [Telluria cellulosilytica]MVW62813.1 EamA-like transporter family protein [Telluria cellulosilytica]